MKILMAAAENGSFRGGKVGGIADVIRDIPPALAATGQQVDVVVPGYGILAEQNNAVLISTISVIFAGQAQQVSVYQAASNETEQITQWIFEHPIFSMCGSGKVYCNDPDSRPFASDATKFAFFSAAVATAVIDGLFGTVDVLHLHDWHTATVLVLREFDARFQALQSIHCVYTIHNLALQGIRPFGDDQSSLNSWFPQLIINDQRVTDPRFPNCYNPMRAGISLSNKVHAVSPSYVAEIVQPSAPQLGFSGGEGLHETLCQAAKEQRLYGILNGCEYPKQITKKLSFNKLIDLVQNEILNVIADKPLTDQSLLIALTRLTQLSVKRVAPSMLVTSIGRVTTQKLQLLQQIMPNGETALEHILTTLGHDGVFIMLGSGNSALENFLTRIAAHHCNFIFIKGYFDCLPEQLYRSGDLFLMPSSFEPCGISQMLAMRAGQACLVHAVGGLKDTVIHNQTGFVFNGDTPLQQAENMVDCFAEALHIQQTEPIKWQQIKQQAKKARFLWQDAAQQYLQLLYR